MIFFKHPITGEVFAYETQAERDAFGASELQAMGPQEVALHLSPPPTAAQVLAQFTSAIQQRLDGFAQTRRYDDIKSACTYATDPDPQFAAEGQACVNLRSATWRTAYEVLDEVQAGSRPMPSSLADIEADLPKLEWPQ